MKNLKLATKIGIVVITILTIGLIIVWKSTDVNVSSVMKDQIIDEMNDAIKTRSKLIEQYISSTESYLVGYAQAPVLKEALLHPEDAGAAANAQNFTKNYGKENPNLENVYLGDYNTKVLASFVEGPIGKTLREGDALRVLRDTLFAKKETNMWNTGVMASLSTGKQVVSMYYPIYNDGEPLGYVGSAVYSEDLKNTLDALAEETGNKTDYLLLDAAKNTYIFCGDEEKVGGPIEEKNISEVIEIGRAHV